MNLSLLRKFFMLVLLVVGWAGVASADDDSSTDVVQLIKSNGDIVGAYADFTTAIENVTEDGMTLKLISDWKSKTDAPDYIAFRNGESATFDLNGKTITFRNFSSGIGVAGESKMTIVDNTGQGKIIFDYYSTIGVIGDGELNIYGGIFELSGKLVARNNGKFNVYGGKFKNIRSSSGSLIAQYDEKTSEMNLYGGYYQGFDESGIQEYVPIGYTVYKSESEEDYPYYVSKCDAELTYNDGTKDVYESVSDNFTIDLKDDGDHSSSLSRIRLSKEIEGKSIDVTIKKNFANTNWQAFYVPFDINVSNDLLQNFDIARIWDTELNLDDNSTTIEFIKLTSGQSISAFTPCLIRAKALGKQDIVFPGVNMYTNQTNSIDCSSVDEKFTFTGVMENTALNGNYALSADGALVQSTNDNAQVTPLKFYMTVENRATGNAVKAKRFALRVIGDDTTGINDINADNAKANAANARVYNLQGVAVGTSLNGLPAGMYIQNGRKVVVK